MKVLESWNVLEHLGTHFKGWVGVILFGAGPWEKAFGSSVRDTYCIFCTLIPPRSHGNAVLRFGGWDGRGSLCPVVNPRGPGESQTLRPQGYGMNQWRLQLASTQIWWHSWLIGSPALRNLALWNGGPFFSVECFWFLVPSFSASPLFWFSLLFCFPACLLLRFLLFPASLLIYFSASLLFPAFFVSHK